MVIEGCTETERASISGSFAKQLKERIGPRSD